MVAYAKTSVVFGRDLCKNAAVAYAKTSVVFGRDLRMRCGRIIWYCAGLESQFLPEFPEILAKSPRNVRKDREIQNKGKP
ncbi:hypothetical protein CMO92_01895 [Candidatus Woesearchaeota archaeon]|nr:hypothetical protein [Candidatus Woesearchaeota archaeon]